MARLEIPALYRLDIGSSRWGWHKMEDLQTAIGLLFERSQNGLPDSLREGTSSDGRPGARELLRQYGHLNIDETFGWTDEQDIDFVPVEHVPFNRSNLFVPAQWSLHVIDMVKNTINPPKLFGADLFNLTKHCLTARERAILELRLGIIDGKEWSLREVGKKFQVTGERIRHMEVRANRKMRQEEHTPTRPVEE